MIMNITTYKTSIVAIRNTDPRFRITDKYVTANRAVIEISNRCPENYKDLILECMRHGWIKPVAHMTERELLFLGLSESYSQE